MSNKKGNSDGTGLVEFLAFRRAVTLTALRQFYAEQMTRCIQSLGVPAQFMLGEPGEQSKAINELDAQLLQAFLGTTE